MANISKYNPEQHVPLARGLAIMGATVEELADGLGVSESSITRWLRDHPEFAEAVELGRTRADCRVVASLYQKAIGGDVTACIFWLKNRQPDEWRDRHEIRQESTVKVTNGGDEFLQRLNPIEVRYRALKQEGAWPSDEQIVKAPMMEQWVAFAVKVDQPPESVIAALIHRGLLDTNDHSTYHRTTYPALVEAWESEG